MKCSFCGKNQNEVKKIVSGPGVCICDECIKICNEIILEERKKENTNFKMEEIPSPKEIKEFLDKYIIAHERAKKVLSVAVYNHYKRIKSNDNLNKEKEKNKINNEEIIELEKVIFFSLVQRGVVKL